jgi:hypothetical protein
MPSFAEILADVDPKAVFADGFEDALIGYARIFNKCIALYDYKKCINILCKQMPMEEACEYFEFNVVGAYVGDHTPGFVTFKDDHENL